MNTPKGMLEREKSVLSGRGSGICLMEYAAWWSGLDSRGKFPVVVVVVAIADGARRGSYDDASMPRPVIIYLPADSRSDIISCYPELVSSIFFLSSRIDCAKARRGKRKEKGR